MSSPRYQRPLVQRHSKPVSLQARSRNAFTLSNAPPAWLTMSNIQHSKVDEVNIISKSEDEINSS